MNRWNIAFLLLVQSGVTAAAGVECPRQCREIGSTPVCGSDGVIYASECEMKRRNCGRPTVVALPSLKHCIEVKGRSCTAFCYGHHDPVCGSDAVTYDNECKWAQQACATGIRLAHPGACFNLTSSNENCPTSCPPVRGFLERPVCASNGNVYRSDCQLRLQTCGQKVTTASFIYCKSTKNCLDHCSKWYDPACGSDGRIYTNNCVMRQQNCGRHVFQVPMVFCLGNEANRYGCPAKCKIWANETVCASDGYLYESECEMRMLHCGSLNKDVSVTTLDFCRPRLEKCNKGTCGAGFNPICGSDGRTYNNECAFRVASCQKGVNRAHEGICHNLNRADSCPKECPIPSPGDGPVCGSDGNVYPSACEMKRRTCGRRVVPVKKSFCRMTAHCDTNCPIEAGLKPVCGSDATLYMSECHMFSKNCGKHIFEVPLAFCLRGVKIGCKEYCSPLPDPVCGSDGKAYSNECFLSLETCRTRGKVRMDSTWKCGLRGNHLDEVSRD